MALRRTTRSTADQETANATTITNAQLHAMIDQGVTSALAARDALRSTNGDDSHNFGTGAPKELPVFPNARDALRSTNGDDSHNSETCELKVKGNDLASYTQRFQELALLCKRMFSEEADKIEKYVGGLPDMIHGNVVASKPNTMQ
nr:reverse transcriptase domain-containing protein [Tanacetum cinerariifolium]